MAETTPPKECVYGDTTNPKLTIALVGDSVAGNWFPALQKIALQQHWKLVTEMRATCTWTATMTIDTTNGTPFTVCHQWGLCRHRRRDRDVLDPAGRPRHLGGADPGNPRDGLHRAGLRGQVRRFLGEV